MSSFDALVASGAVRRDEPLAPFTTYKFGGAAQFFGDVLDVATLEEVLAAARDDGVVVLVLGRGSNLVVSDAGFPGLVVRLAGSFNEIDVRDGGVVVAGGAVPLPRLARETVKAGRSGLEFFVGIPGSVGGAVAMNAGCHGSETADRLLHATIVSALDGGRRTQSAAELDMGYRHSAVAPTDIVVDAAFATEPGDRDAGEATLREITQWRKAHQPGGTFNAGSVYKNPPGDAAGRIIDALGLKGFRCGGAAVSERHANFFVADPGATAQDVFDLVWAVRRRVGEATGVWLEPEIRFAGPFEQSRDVSVGPSGSARAAVGEADTA